MCPLLITMIRMMLLPSNVAADAWYPRHLSCLCVALLSTAVEVFDLSRGLRILMLYVSRARHPLSDQNGSPHISSEFPRNPLMGTWLLNPRHSFWLWRSILPGGRCSSLFCRYRVGLGFCLAGCNSWKAPLALTSCATPAIPQFVRLGRASRVVLLLAALPIRVRRRTLKSLLMADQLLSAVLCEAHVCCAGQPVFLVAGLSAADPILVPSLAEGISNGHWVDSETAFAFGTGGGDSTYESKMDGGRKTLAKIWSRFVTVLQLLRSLALCCRTGILAVPVGDLGSQG